MSTTPPPPPPPPASPPPPPPAGGGAPPPPPAGGQPAAAAAGGMSKGCIIGLAVLGALVVMGIIGAVVAISVVGNAVEDSFEDGGIPGVFGGECAEFTMSYMGLSMMGMITAGADETQRQEVEDALGEISAIAPSEIEDEIVVLSDAFGDAMALALSGGPGGEPSSEAQAEAEAILESPEVVAAQDEINAWVEANCS